ncbi:tyrosine-type recombinase/integrase [Neptunicella marina]|uniref:Integrase family protein n=1 Tax=Neptunicella marina TaxID=2125989 RepID=A0A8J6M725_9ALTE|nr:integrase family protein [Neptunicella marina]MBC3767451.1 integrase family protein [Neptunicella marina]
MSATKFRFTEQALLKLSGSDKRTRYYDSQMPGLIIDVLPSNKKTFRVYKKLPGTQKPLAVTIGSFPSVTVEQARKQARKAMADIAEGMNPNDSKRHFRAASVTLQAVYKEYTHSRELKPITLRGYDQVMDCYFDDWAKKRLADLTENRIYRRHCELTKRSPAQADLAMRMLRALFNFARAEYKSSDGRTLFPYNPVAVLSEKRCWNNVARKQTRLRPSQLKPFLKVVNEMRNEAIVHRQDFTATVCDFVEFMTYTGLRKTELLELEWKNVFLDDQLFCLDDTKNGHGLELPITKPLEEIFKRRTEYRVSGFVFGAENHHGRVMEPKKIIKQMNELADVSFTLHDLRRTFCSVAETIGVGTYTLKRLLNHKTSRSDVTAGYTVLTAEELREPANRVCKRLLEYAGIETGVGDSSIEQLKLQLSSLSKEQRLQLMSAMMG